MINPNLQFSLTVCLCCNRDRVVMSPSSVEFLAKISNTTTFWKLLYCFPYIKISKYQILPNKTEHRLKDQKMKDDPGLDHGFFAFYFKNF